MIQQHAEIGGCLHANLGVHISKHHFRVHSEFLMEQGYHLMLMRTGGAVTVFPLMCGFY